jgi:cytochrome P450
MLQTIVEAAVLYAFSWALWKAVRNYFVKSALDNIPGPSPGSFWKGSFPQIFDVNGWDFHREIAENYGPVVKVKALLGESQLYVFDPKALHHIVVKDQYIYEETTSFILGNRLIFGHGLLGTLGEQHRKQRKMLNPVFSIVHMREMSELTIVDSVD